MLKVLQELGGIGLQFTLTNHVVDFMRLIRIESYDKWLQTAVNSLAHVSCSLDHPAIYVDRQAGVSRKRATGELERRVTTLAVVDALVTLNAVCVRVDVHD